MTAEYVATKLISSRGRMQAHVAAHTRWSRWNWFARHWDTVRGLREPAMTRAEFWGRVADLCAP